MTEENISVVRHLTVSEIASEVEINHDSAQGIITDSLGYLQVLPRCVFQFLTKQNRL